MRPRDRGATPKAFRPCLLVLLEPNVAASAYPTNRPCLPTKAPKPPVGGLWQHEIKHDGFRVIARKDGERVSVDAGGGKSQRTRWRGVMSPMPSHDERSGEDRPAWT